MPPLSQLMQMGPGNVFGGLGKGLGAGIGGGITKQIRRPLFNKLADKYVKGKEGMAEQAALSTLGLTQAPEAGAPQYENFMMQMNQALAPAQGRADTARALWEQDPDAANEYLLAEQKTKGSGAGGKVTKFDRMQDPQAKMIYAKLKEVDAKMLEVQQDPNLTYAEKQNAMGGLQLQKQPLVRDYETFTGVKLSEPSITQMAELINKEATAENINKQITGKVDDAVDGIYKTLPESAKGLKSRISKATDTLLKLRESEKRVESYVKNYDPDNVSSVDQAAAIKQLGLSIEPGLQVTEGEVELFAGNSWAKALLKEIQSIKQAAGGFFKKGGDLDTAAAEGGWSNAELTKAALIKASEVIGASQKVLQEFIMNAARNTVSSAEQTIAEAIQRNQTIPQDVKASLKPKVEDKILQNAVPMGLLTYEPMRLYTEADFAQKGNTPPPEQQFDANGNEISQTDEPGAAGDAQRAAAAKKAAAAKTTNPIKKKTTEVAGQVAGTLVDDLLAWEEAEMDKQGAR